MVLRSKRRLRHNEDGFASLVIALTLIIILALVTVGFAQLIRREQTNALNKQLSSQAFYAAESGVNDAIKAIKDGQPGVDSINSCSAMPATGTLSVASGKNLDPNSGHNVAYTCVLVNTNPNKLFHSGVGDSSKENSNSNAWTIVGDTGGVTAGEFSVTWVSSKGHTVAGLPNAPTKFTTENAWGTNPALLRFSVTSLGGGLRRTDLMQDTYTTYLYPVNGNPGTAPSYAPVSNSAAQGQIYGAKCIPANKGTQASCKVTINMAGAPAGPYLFHIASIYDASDITITADGGSTNFANSQAVIDATGKAQDVLRRIQVTYSLQSSVPVPPALDAVNICKRFTTNPSETDFFSVGGAAVNPPSADVCDLEN